MANSHDSHYQEWKIDRQSDHKSPTQHVHGIFVTYWHVHDGLHHHIQQ